MSRDFDDLINEALEAERSGWDFSFLHGRTVSDPLPWDYGEVVRKEVVDTKSMLDIGTGGGEVLSCFAPLPQCVFATEGYKPNVPIARDRLEPLGVTVIETVSSSSECKLPFDDGYFDLVIDRHEAYYPPEIYRLLRQGGIFITQQVGSMNGLTLNRCLDDDLSKQPEWCLDCAVCQLVEAGFQILNAQEAYPVTTYLDIGAIVYYLLAVPWQVEGFDVTTCRQRLLKLHEHMLRDGGLRVEEHRFLISARKV